MCVYLSLSLYIYICICTYIYIYIYIYTHCVSLPPLFSPPSRCRMMARVPRQDTRTGFPCALAHGRRDERRDVQTDAPTQ